MTRKQKCACKRMGKADSYHNSLDFSPMSKKKTSQSIQPSDSLGFENHEITKTFIFVHIFLKFINTSFNSSRLRSFGLWIISSRMKDLN